MDMAAAAHQVIQAGRAVKCPDTCTHPRVTLVDGSTTCTWSPAWKHQCEAQHVCNLPSLLQRRRYLLAISDKRGEPAGLELRATVAKLWKNAQPAVANTGSP
jgi:hypothetical protein